MLNELYDAALHLADLDIKTHRWHDLYKELPRARPVKGGSGKPTFFVFVASNGDISKIERVEKNEDIAGIRRLETANGYSFPYFNIPPLWSNSGPETKDDKSFKQKLDQGRLSSSELEAFFREKISKAKTWEQKHFTRLTNCMGFTAEKLQTALGPTPEEYRCIEALIERVLGMTGESFYRKLQIAFKSAMTPEFASSFFDGAFHFGDKTPKNDVSILLELSDASAFKFPAKHSEVCTWINNRLLAAASDHKPLGEVDAFGNDMAGSKGRLPAVKVGALGPVILRAMNHESPCQKRYGRIDERSFPIGRQSRDVAKSALAWLTHPERKGKTWDSVSRAADNKEILLAYPSELPSVSPKLAFLFAGGGTTENRGDNSARFEDCAENVTGSLRAVLANRRDLDIRVFVLRKMDKIRTRVSWNRRYSANHLIDSAERWRAECKNLPLIQVKQFIEKGETKWLSPETPFPMEVVWALNTLWSRDGGTASRVKGLSADDGVVLLLGEGVPLEDLLHRALYTLTRNGAGLLMALAQEQHGRGQVLRIPKNYSRQPLILPSVVALLLSKLHKEQYMENAPYLIGRLLGLADQLHYYYCVHVRNDPDTPPNALKLPPQLMGNALMATALEEPIKALALYADRILPYQAWAKTFRGSEENGKRVGGTLKRLGEVCSMVSLKTIPEQCSDGDKAQMLLGYLARSDRSNSETDIQGDQP